MSYNIRAYKVFIASPGDVPEEREKIREAIHQLNEDLIQDAILVPVLFVPVMWEQIPPRAGRSPQTQINERGLDTCDVFITLLWTKLGEGTIEELNRHVDVKKYAMAYRLNKVDSTLRDILQDPKRVKDYQKLEEFFKNADTRKGNIVGLYQTVDSGDELVSRVKDDLRRIRPILSEEAINLLDEGVVESDMLSEIDDDNVLAEVIPNYKPHVSRNLVLKMADRGLDYKRGDIVWKTILAKFTEKNGSMNLTRTLLGLAYRRRFDHGLFKQGAVQLYDNNRWMFVNFMKKLHLLNPTEFDLILNAEWLTEERTKNDILAIRSSNLKGNTL